MLLIRCPLSKSLWKLFYLKSDLVQNPFATPADNLERLFHRALYCMPLIKWIHRHKVRRQCRRAPEKHHTIPADVLPNDSEALFQKTLHFYPTVTTPPAFIMFSVFVKKICCYCYRCVVSRVNFHHSRPSRLVKLYSYMYFPWYSFTTQCQIWHWVLKLYTQKTLKLYEHIYYYNYT